MSSPFLLRCLLLSCSINAEAATRDVPVQGPQREQTVRQVVIHATGGPDCDPLRRFRGDTLDGIVGHFLRHQGRISIHYIIGRDGEVVRMVPESMVAYHTRGQNADSIGIELINDGDGQDPFADAQIAALTSLLRDILDRYGLTGSDIRTHAELDDSSLTCNGKQIKRKQDPGPAFPWTALQRQLKQRAVTPKPEQRAQLDRREAELRAALQAIERDLDDARNALGRNRPRRASSPPVADPVAQAEDDRRGSIQEAISQLLRRETELRAEIRALRRATGDGSLTGEK
ncbi:N-acetylmuramoyl-L-alanine amidase [Thiobaca trueperi]|uniref:N-acetylmuramoyl-L-alanine amidase n=1 Tax=Thiobaca trueperi TaxID=127458 RepID=A0A4R3N2N1_9GAMM|nr:peptidoglycan recognition family protein [Thiobaca trueperi]TCT21303.1 N-acetylmuramoyl-L-alanine amidase [Thiobaca trueperi]